MMDNAFCIYNHYFHYTGSLTNACCLHQHRQKRHTCFSCLHCDEFGQVTKPPGSPYKKNPYLSKQDFQKIYSFFHFFFHIHFCYSYFSNVKVPGVLGKGGQMIDDSFETLAFGVCNTDGVEGLSWAELEQCQVSK